MEASLGRLQGHRVKELRERRKYTQQELAELMHTDARQIWRYEKEKTNPNSEVVHQLAYFLKTNSSYLLGESDDDTPEMVNEDLSADERAILIALRNRPELMKLVLGFIKETG